MRPAACVQRSKPKWRPSRLFRGLKVHGTQKGTTQLLVSQRIQATTHDTFGKHPGGGGGGRGAGGHMKPASPHRAPFYRNPLDTERHTDTSSLYANYKNHRFEKSSLDPKTRSYSLSEQWSLASSNWAGLEGFRASAR